MNRKLNKKKVFLVISIILIIISIVVFAMKKDNNNENANTNTDINTNQNEEVTNDEKMYDDKSTLEDLKEEYKITGSDEIYEIETEDDGRKVINVKADINYKVAFCGMIKKSKPTFQELDSVFEKNSPNKSGIWINPNDESKILAYLNNNKYLNSKYKIDENGYLEIEKSNKQSEYDKKLEKIIKGDKQYLINISSVYYMVDTVTGEIVDNPYNELDRYQVYDYCKDEDKILIFISENKDKKLNEEEMFTSVIELLNIA